MKALALLEFESIARGVLAVDRMLKQAPIALLRCGTIHPGRYLALCGGSVASVEEAYRAGRAAGEPLDGVLLADPHPALAAALSAAPPGAAAAGAAVAGSAAAGAPAAAPAAEGDFLVLETDSSPTLLGLLDGILKAVPVALAVLRLADDLGGRAFAILAGELADLEDARALAARGPAAPRITIVARPDPDLRACVAADTRFAPRPPRALAAGELLPSEAAARGREGS